MLVLSKELFDIQATIEGRFILKHVRDMIGTYSQEKKKKFQEKNGIELFYILQVLKIFNLKKKITMY